MLYYCTLFDSNYCIKGLTLYRSLRRHSPEFQLFILCLDDATYVLLEQLALPEVYLVHLAELEAADSGLHRAKATRTQVEYYFTCFPCFPLWILTRFTEVDLLTYLDADLYFFSSPLPLYRELDNASILLIEHKRFTPGSPLPRCGRFNSGSVMVRKDESSLSCLRRWRTQCLAWCEDRIDDNRYADQKYLDDWPDQCPGVVVSQLPGAGVAPWNIALHRFKRQRDSLLVVDDSPLIFFHFACLSPRRCLAETGAWTYFGNHIPLIVRRSVYAHYLRELLAVRRWLASAGYRSSCIHGIPRSGRTPWRLLVKEFLHGGVLLTCGRFIL